MSFTHWNEFLLSHDHVPIHTERQIHTQDAKLDQFSVDTKHLVRAFLHKPEGLETGVRRIATEMS